MISTGSNSQLIFHIARPGLSLPFALRFGGTSGPAGSPQPLPYDPLRFQFGSEVSLAHLGAIFGYVTPRAADTLSISSVETLALRKEGPRSTEESGQQDGGAHSRLQKDQQDADTEGSSQNTTQRPG
jgi:hypothetical protein